MLKINQLFLRVFAPIVMLIFVIFLCVSFFWSKNIYLSQIEHNLKNNIEILSLTLKNIHYLDDTIKQIKALTNHRITIVNQEGQVIAESDKNKELLENHSQRVEIVKAKFNDFGVSIRYSKTLNKKLLYVTKQIQINEEIYYIRMADYIDNINKNFFDLALQYFIIFLFFLASIFLFNYFISRKIQTETQNIIDFLQKLSDKKSSLIKYSKFCKEFYDIGFYLNKFAYDLYKKHKKTIKKKTQLKLANKQKDDIISALSHEFKNPLAVINGYAQTLLEDETILPQTKVKFLEKIKNNSDKMNKLINKLRLSINLENSQLTLHLQDTSLKTLLKTIICDLQQNYKKRNIIIKGEDKIIKVDRELFTIVLNNLIENALKYSQEDVVIQITKNAVHIVDKGLGLSQKDCEKIKEKFYRVDKLSWNNSLGLGLFITANIVKLHHFTLDINSKKAKGSTFCVIF